MVSKKEQLLTHLKHHTYCRLKPSSVNGVGVFAIKDIPAGVNPFTVNTPRNYLKYVVVELDDADVSKLPPGVRKMLKDFCKYNNTYDVPFLGFNAIDISFYLNHSNKPNLQIIDDPRSEYLAFKTVRKIKQGEELFIDYRRYKKA